MRWRKCDTGVRLFSNILLILLVLTDQLHGSNGARRTAQRRKDIARSELYLPTPSAESLSALAQAMGAASFEHYTEGKALVKRLIPADSHPDLDVVEHQGMIGKAGVDFPAFPSIPNTGFNCKNVPTGYYADLETDCQVFHICDTSRKISFLCPNGTIFSQSHLICDWWFKVDCASAPTLYESSAEYYSNEQKKTQKVTKTLTKNPDLQQIGTDTNIRAESRRTSINIPSTTERLLRHRQRLQSETPSSPTTKSTARSFHQTLFGENNFNPTQRTQATTAFEKRRKNLVQLIANNFGNLPIRATQPTYTEGSTYKPTVSPGDYNNIREMQVAAETASFTNNNNRQYLQDFNNKNYRPYPVYTPNLPQRVSKSKNSPTLTTLYDFRDKQSNQLSQETVTKRPTLVPYTKSYTTTINEKHEPYTRPGISLLKGFLEKEKNKTLATPTEKVIEITERSDLFNDRSNIENKVIIETAKDKFESVTKIPLTTRPEITYFTETSSPDRFDVYSSTNDVTQTTEPSYQERRERLMRKLNLDAYGPTTPTVTDITEKFYGDQPNRPGLIVPPSLTPKTLHTLAIYYATALDNLSTTATPEQTETLSPAFDEYEILEEGLPALFSRHTINKYGKLFGQGVDNSELLEEIKLDPNGTYNDLADDLSVQQSQNPIATSPQIRELAQVFTHALSAYLQDPVQFRKVLSDIRPTHPSFGDMLSTTEEPFNTEPTTTINEEDDEILGFSDDNKIRPALTSLRDPKALNLATDYALIPEDTTTTPKPSTTEAVSTTTARIPFKCCGKISATYTSASTPREASTTPVSFINTASVNFDAISNSINDTVTTTENSYSISKVGGFQNNTSPPNNSPYGKDVHPTDAKPLNQYVEVTNLPTAWGVDASAATVPPITNSHSFESKKIRTTTYIPTTTPIYFTETESVELENEEELQRAHSQSFVTPQDNSLRQGKQINFEETKTTVKKPSEELEAPTFTDIDTTTVQTTTVPTTTAKVTDTESATTTSDLSSVFTSPDSDKSTNEYQWLSTFNNWHSTIVDPITLNDGLSPTGPEQYVPQTASHATTPFIDYTATNEQAFSSSINVEQTTPGSLHGERFGRLLAASPSTESAQDITTIADTVVEKAKEIMGGMNATTTEKLMNVMKKTKSKTVRRLILLLVQTCDDDHNTTAEASKKALLEALMAVSQKDMEELAKEEAATNVPTLDSDLDAYRTTNVHRRTDNVLERQEVKSRQTDRRGKSLNFDPSAINALSNPTTVSYRTTTDTDTPEPTTSVRPTPTSFRGAKKFQTQTTPVEIVVSSTTENDIPKAEARVAPNGAGDLKTASDTRALELLRSLYTIAARWG